MTRPISYVDCDVPEGMTLEEYRAARHCAGRTGRGRWFVRRRGAGLLRHRHWPRRRPRG